MTRSFVQSSREFAGRLAGVGYADEKMGRTAAHGPPLAAEAAKMASAKPAHVV